MQIEFSVNSSQLDQELKFLVNFHLFLLFNFGLNFLFVGFPLVKFVVFSIGVFEKVAAFVFFEICTDLLEIFRVNFGIYNLDLGLPTLIFDLYSLFWSFAF